MSLVFVFVTVVLSPVLTVVVTVVAVVFVRFLVFLLHLLPAAARLPALLLHRQGDLGQLGALPGALVAGSQVAVTGHAVVAVSRNSSLAQRCDGIRVID